MIERQSLTLTRGAVGDTAREEAQEDLLRNGVLVARFPRSDGAPRDLSFAHHALFDYAVARVVLEFGEASDLTERLSGAGDTALWLAPAALLAFRMLWEGDTSRERFWTTAEPLATAHAAGGFCRMLPGRVAAELATTLADFQPILRRLGPSPAPGEGAVFLLQQTVGAVLADVRVARSPTGPGEEPWCPLIRELAKRAPGTFVYPVNAALVTWTKASEALPVARRQALGQAALALLDHLVTVGVNLDAAYAAAIQGLARCLPEAGPSAAESLQRLLEPASIAKRGSRDLFWLAQESKRLIKWAPTLLGDLYRAAFLAPLPDRGQERQLGDSQILVLRTDARQDLRLVHHLLAAPFEEFAASHPHTASCALRDVLRGYVPRARARQPKERLALRIGGKEIRVTSDYSHIWWPPGQDRRGHDEELVLLDGWVAGLVRAGADRNARADIDEAVVALLEAGFTCSMAAALMVGRKLPQTVGRLLLPALQKPAALVMADLVYELAELLRVLHPSLDAPERGRCEAAILAVPHAHIRAVYLGVLEEDCVALPAASEQRVSLERQSGLPENRPPPGVVVEWVGTDPDERFRDARADIDAGQNRTLRDLIEAAEAIRAEDGDRPTRRAAVDAAWPGVRRLFDMLMENPEANDRLRRTGWQAIGEKAYAAARVCITPEDLGQYPELRRMLLELVRTENPMLPDGTPDPEREERFASGPGWPSPAPRVDGARTAMVYLRASGNEAEENVVDAVRRLADDGAPEVRLQIRGNLNLISLSAPTLMWELFASGLEDEVNRAIVTAMLSSLSLVCHLRPGWCATAVLELMQDEGDNQDEGDELLQAACTVLTRCWLVADVAEAGAWLAGLADDPVSRGAWVRRVAHLLRKAVVQGPVAPADDFHERVRRKSRDFLLQAARNTAAAWRRALSEGDRASMQQLLNVADTISRELYFGSGAHQQSAAGADRAEAVAPGVLERFLAEFREVLAELASVRHPAVTHHLLELLEALIPADPAEVFALVSLVTEGGVKVGYQFESLGEALLVRLVRRYLADHRDIFSERPEFRVALMDHLNSFAVLGWPEARRLAYDLPGLLR
jgi:hypothetical protein